MRTRVILTVAILFALLGLQARAQSGPLVVNDGEVVTISTNTTVEGIVVNAGGELRFDPAHSVTLTSTGNIVIAGVLTIKPLTTTHTLRFTGINESAFVGGGMVPLSTDVGLWVMDDGTLDIAGAPKTAWTRAAGTIPQNATQITLESVPVGWSVGDEISIAPTEAITVGSASWNGFDLRIITAIDGDTITLNTPTTRAHPVVPSPFNETNYSAEILNLTRNVRIEGTGDGNHLPANNGRAHIFIRSTQPQNIAYLAIRHMGPRKVDGKYTLKVLGRYGLHFHMAGDGSRGSLVEGVVVRDSGSHAFVPHASHGIVFSDTISYNTFEDAYWWDIPPCTGCGDLRFSNDSHDITITHAAAALVRTDPTFRGYTLTGFLLGQGEDNSLTITDSVAVGVQGNIDASGFRWPSQGHAVWHFAHNIAHNNKVDGIFAWQNDGLPHVVRDFVAYRNGESGINHGAYTNIYHYHDVDLIGNGVGLISKATSPLQATPTRPDGYIHVFERVRMDSPFSVSEHNATSVKATLVLDCVLPTISVDEDTRNKPVLYDFVNCTKLDGTAIEPSDFDFIFTWPSSLYRVQRPNGTAYQIDGNADVTTIDAFYVLPLSELAQQVKDILDAHPEVRQELINAGIIH